MRHGGGGVEEEVGCEEQGCYYGCYEGDCVSG